MTEEERSNVNELDEAAQSLALQVRSAFENSSQFGGMFIDRDAHRVVFLAVGEAVVMRRAVTAADKSGLAVVRSAKFSYTQLQQVGLELATARAGVLASQGVTVLATDVNERENVVEVSLREESERARGIVSSELPEGIVRFIGPVSMQSTGVNRLDAPPLAGGQRITRPAQQVGYITACTSAFAGYNSRQVATQTVREYFLITAGHCGGDATRPCSQSGDNPAQGAYPIGASDRNTYEGTTAADSQRIPIRAVDAAFVIRISSIRSNVVSTQQAASADVIGERVCMSGATSSEMERCGTLQSRNFTGGAGDGRTIVRQRTASWVALQGDSGGSVYNISQAKGVVFGNAVYGAGTPSEVVRGVYSHIGEVLTALGVVRVS